MNSVVHRDPPNSLTPVRHPYCHERWADSASVPCTDSMGITTWYANNHHDRTERPVYVSNHNPIDAFRTVLPHLALGGSQLLSRGMVTVVARPRRIRDRRAARFSLFFVFVEVKTFFDDWSRKSAS